MEAYRRSCSLKDRWFLFGEFASSDLEEAARRMIESRRYKIVIIETTDPEDVLDAEAR